MKKHLNKDLNRRICVNHFQHKRLSYKVLQYNSFLSTKLRFLAFHLLSNLNENGSSTKIRNRCVLTGRARGIHSYFKISRIMIRQLASQGLLPGVKKASW